MKVEINHLTKVIQGNVVLDDINACFSCASGENGGRIYGIQGINGSGKTMLMRVICGLVLPTMGTVSIDGEIIGKGISFPRSIGLLLENPIFIDEFTGAKNLSLLCDIKRLVSQAQIGDTLRRVGLNPSDKRPFRKYSLGMKQRLGIAAAIVESPDLILLDEPFNALDESGIKEIRDLLRELRQKGKLIVLTCHDRQQMESLADEIIAMREGRIVNVDKNCHEEVRSEKQTTSSSCDSAFAPFAGSLFRNRPENHTLKWFLFGNRGLLWVSAKAYRVEWPENRIDRC